MFSPNRIWELLFLYILKSPYPWEPRKRWNTAIICTLSLIFLLAVATTHIETMFFYAHTVLLQWREMHRAEHNQWRHSSFNRNRLVWISSLGVSFCQSWTTEPQVLMTGFKKKRKRKSSPSSHCLKNTTLKPRPATFFYRSPDSRCLKFCKAQVSITAALSP